MHTVNSAVTSRSPAVTGTAGEQQGESSGKSRARLWPCSAARAREKEGLQKCSAGSNGLNDERHNKARVRSAREGFVTTATGIHVSEAQLSATTTRQKKKGWQARKTPNFRWQLYG